MRQKIGEDVETTLKSRAYGCCFSWVICHFTIVYSYIMEIIYLEYQYYAMFYKLLTSLLHQS